MGKSGSWLIKKCRSTPAVAAATATGTNERGLHSKSSNSTASNVAASGVENTPAMPAAAPATSSVERSASDRWKYCAKIEPTDPAVMMMGPSAPNGPPVPIATAEPSGLKIATRGLIFAPFTRIDSSASGMP